MYPTENKILIEWIREIESLCKPESVYFCDGSKQEYDELAEFLVKRGTLEKLSDTKRPNSYLARSDPADTARVEDRTFICSVSESDAGPTNNWMDPLEMKETMVQLFEGSMRGRTLYVVPFSMGPIGSPFSRIGIQITDSAYVVVNMRIMSKMGTEALDALGKEGEFVRCLHSVGYPIEAGVGDVAWPCDPEHVYVSHFPETREIWSYGSGYGGNALLGKKCLALRIASVVARNEGWLAEHMLLLKLTSPSKEVHYIAGAFPSACGKTNLAMMIPSLEGWQVDTLGDDICWIRKGDDGRLYGMNPEMGFFGVAPGTSYATNPNAMETIAHDTIFTNTAKTGDGDVWWEGLRDEEPMEVFNWKGERYIHGSTIGPSAHPNARFTVSALQAPHLCSEWQNPLGVPLSAIILGGRRSRVVPLVTEARSWEHGVFLGSTMASETTAAAVGAVGNLRRDPFAMLPFCGYHMADYFSHWLDFTTETKANLPRIYLVNWFLRDQENKLVWPGFGENIRVLSWIVDRLANRVEATDTALGLVPKLEDFELEGLDIDPGGQERLLGVSRSEITAEVAAIRTFYEGFGKKLPPELWRQLADLADRNES